MRGLLFNRRRWLLWAVAVVIVGLGGSAIGWLLAEAGVVIVAALVAALVAAVMMLKDMETAYVAVIAVISLLPFGSLPFSIGFTPTFLDLALIGLFGTWVLALLLSEEQAIIATPVGGPVLAFALLAVVAFVAGLSHGALTTYLIRHFAEVLMSIALFYLVVNTVRDTDRLGRLVRWLILGAGAAAGIGIVLYVIPENLAIRGLSALGRFGYPTGPGVIWYIRDDPAEMKRAMGTSVQPNVLGSLLSFGLVMLTPQLVTKRPILRRVATVLLMGLVGVCLILTVSRSAMLGAGGAIIAISILRYRKLLPLLLVAAIIFAVSPWSQALLTHFVEGFRGEDLSTKMRFGEYKDTATLIQRYPLFGVGFSGAPDIDIYVAVASLYLIIAAQMGLVGLLAFVLILAVVLWRFFKYRSAVSDHPDLEPLWYGVHAAIIGGAISGIFDHYFFSLDFHHSVTLFWLVVGLATAATELAASDSKMVRSDKGVLGLFRS
ncbi:MAG: O-antigen ligase family protein [Anaerolineae bacterium]|nr:O-antigen ligase family protein [Anaerolineae bacterium]